MTDTAARPAEDADLDRLAPIEKTTDALFVAHFGRPVGDGPTPTGAQRAAEPGFLLVVGRPAVGFAHVVDLAGQAHLEQLSVDTSHARQGLGARLLEGAVAEAGRRGHREVTLCTFADVPWNAPFYARHGFTVVTDPPAVVAALRDHERHLGLDAIGRRVVMRRGLDSAGPGTRHHLRGGSMPTTDIL